MDGDRTGAGFDSGLAALVLLARYFGIAADAAELQHRLGKSSGEASGAEDLLRAARWLKLKARFVAVKAERLSKTPFPCLAAMTDGSFLILGQIVDARDGTRRLLLQRAGDARPELMEWEDFLAVWNGHVLLLARRAIDAPLGRKFDLSWFMPAVWRYRRVLGEVLLASLFLQILGLVTPLFFQVVIDKVLVHRGLSTLDVIVLGVVIVSLFEVLLGALRTYVFSHTTNRIDVELSARVFDHLIGLPIAYFEARRVGDSVARVRELENIRSFLTGSALTLVIDLLFTFVFLGVMLSYSVDLTLIVVASFPFYIALSAGVTPLFRHRLDEKFRRGAENQAFLVESVTGVETIKAMAVEPALRRRWEEQVAAYVRASFSTQTLGNIASQTVQLINKLTLGATLYFGAKAVIDGDLTVGGLVAFNMLSGHVAQPVLRLAQMWQDFQQARISVERLGDILNSPVEPRPRNVAASLPPIKGLVSFEHVSFRYRLDGPEILKDISFSVPAGQMIGIVGPSGSGKSTLTKLIQRLYTPESGKVLIDGVDLAMADHAWLRRQVGVVLQENMLFNRTVRDNIALADPALPMERVIAAARLAGAHDFILELANGYDTEIGERGTTLSGGQRQRIAIARALIGNPRILIFDEATSALDYESERIIQDNMAGIARGRTVFVIAHRLSAVRRADRILTIEKGRLVEDGNHDALIRTGGRYATLYGIQAGVHVGE
ncbi:type I secretion system permease/ATPase [Telmatospirillum siberiense]|uniref:Type I secretion system permease/ATPase n=2 Tax=Telmatospirillum siberiense TaxID=382514 RepID=A0A2N3PLV3_9PROT|nr:type I secretion system permease/ATPase [Telmatospirillum siberiense]PKU21373.1 type I secretion system permease/ATPase [Telmatospirillum siberiense]